MKTLYPVQQNLNSVEITLYSINLRILILICAAILLSFYTLASNYHFTNAGVENFSVQLKNNSIELNWTTPQDANFNYFVIEKSIDGKNYKDAAIIFATPGTSLKQAYLFNDKISTNKRQTVYYRLRIVDSSQHYKMSEVRALRMANIKTQKISSPFVNTITDSLVLLIPKKWINQKISYELYNAFGDSIKSWQRDSASKMEVVNVKDLAEGKYLLKADCLNEEFLQRFIRSH